MAGYSGTPLAQKLGIKPGHRVALANAPKGFSKMLGALSDGVKFVDFARDRAVFDVAVAFFRSLADFDRAFATLKKRMRPAAGLWIAWPKRASGVPTDLTEDAIREIAVDRGLVDNKVCAIDETWSGLRLVIRLADRPKPAKKKRA